MVGAEDLHRGATTSGVLLYSTQGGPMHEGHFVGGPLDGLTYTIRNQNSVLAVDPELGVAWLYKHLPMQPEGLPNYALDMTPGETDAITGARVYDEQRSIEAAEAGYDIIVVPGEKPSQEEIDEEVLTDGE
jgi:hypothetical protein